MAEGIALLSVYGDADSDNEELDDSPVKAPVDAAGSIVDYAHDEGHVDEVKLDETEVGDVPVEVLKSPIVEPDGLAPMETEENEQEAPKEQETSENGVEVPVPSAEEDVLAKFWPSPPSTPCSAELQAKFANFLRYKERGRNFNEDLRHSKGYRNPDFLELAVMHQNIDEIGSCFDPEVFNPHGYDRMDYADALAAEQRKEADRREQERRQNQRTSVDFVRATQLLTSQKVSLAAAATSARLAEGTHNVISTTSVVHTTTTTTEVRSETRTNKKSKWDKAGHH